MCPRRQLGARGPTLSSLTLGSMRIDERFTDSGRVQSLLEEAFALGVDTLHSSDEYSSFALFRSASAAAARAIGTEPRHVVKLAEPAFGESRFDASRFAQRIRMYVAALSVTRLAVVQWMIRADTSRPAQRLDILHRDAAAIGTVVEELRAEGLLEALVVFPYSSGDVNPTLAKDWCDGIAVYLNPCETEYVPAVQSAHSCRKGAIGIRPFAAGRAVGAARGTSVPNPFTSPAAQCIGWPLLHPAVATVVASISTTEHLKEAVRFASIAADQALFDELALALAPTHGAIAQC